MQVKSPFRGRGRRGKGEYNVPTSGCDFPTVDVVINRTTVFDIERKEQLLPAQEKIVQCRQCGCCYDANEVNKCPNINRILLDENDENSAVEVHRRPAPDGEDFLQNDEFDTKGPTDEELEDIEKESDISDINYRAILALHD